MENKRVVVYDIETIKCLFTYFDFNIDSKQYNVFVISEYQNDLEPLIKHLNSLQGQIGFNNLNFDAQVLQFILDNYNQWLELTSLEVCNIIYKYAQYVIDISNKGGFPPYSEWKLQIPQLDLFKIHHYNNKNRFTSLKWVEFSIDFPNIEEMSVDHSIESLTQEQIDQVKSYNKNDVDATYQFYLITIGETEHPLYKGIDKIQLRKDIQNEFKLHCLNWSDVKIGEQIAKLTYSKLSNIDIKSIQRGGTSRESILVKDCVIMPIYFESEQLKSFYNRFTQVKFNPLKLKENDDKGTKFNFKGLDITFGFGGLHSIDKPRKFDTNNEYYISDKDCTGMYPRTIIEYKLYPSHLNSNWYKGCEYVYNERAYKYKPLIKRGDKKAQSFSEAFKYSANGGFFGKSNEITSWQYDPLVAFKITISNQFALLKYAEMMILNDIQVISLNTDGCLCYVKNTQKELYNKLGKEWETITKHTLEETLYKSFVQTSVNDYLAITTDNKVKTKGDFVSEFEINKNKSARIVPIALQNYYLKDIVPEETIYNHTNIFNFCLGVKSKSDSKLIHFNPKDNTEIKLQKVNRYYVSNNGLHLLKRMNPLIKNKNKITNQLDIFGIIDGGTRESEVEAGYLTTIYNKHLNKPIKEYDINYEFYLKKCYKIINTIK